MKTLILAMLMAQPVWAANYQPQVLHQIRQQAWSITNQHPQDRVIAVFDVDDTLIDTRYRTIRILSAWIAAQAGTPLESEAAKLQNLQPDDIGFDLSVLLQRRGVNLQIQPQIQSFWAQHFFNNDFCASDNEILDAGAYLRSLQKLHTDIFYVTGRVEAAMQTCTVQSFQHLGFPLGPHAHLIMRENPAQDEFSYKQEVFDTIRQQGQVIAAFENEPRNVNLEKDSFPEALTVFLDTFHSDSPVVPETGIAWVKNFEPF